MLVALRLWRYHWQQDRISLTVRSDNYSVLFLLAKLRSRSAALTTIARELALELSDGTYRPDTLEHLP
eukprot:1486026-Amphidinium_carterae.1